MPRGDRGGTSKGSGVRCVAANCGNTHLDGFSLHSFPKDQSLRRQWTSFVKVKRANWDGPTEYSALCSSHFTMDCFPFRVRFEIQQTGKKPKKTSLNTDAVPTINPIVNSDTAQHAPICQREATTPTTSRKRNISLEMLSPSEEKMSQASPPKKIRRGYLKRETARILAESMVNKQSTTSSNDDDHDDVNIPSNTMQTKEEDEYEIETCTGESRVSIGCQINRKPYTKSRYCQTNIKVKGAKTMPIQTSKTSIACQTERIIEMVDAFTQVRPHHLEMCRDRNISTCSSDTPVSSPIPDDPTDDNYKPPTDGVSSDEVTSESEDERQILPETQPKFIVFQENLLELFDTCPKCTAKTKGKIKYTTGSLVKIEQECHVCEYTRNWFSQPFIGGKPAGNLMISSSILFSGAIPSKGLRMFKFCNIATISTSTFLNHQKSYLFPAIGNVWYNFQQDYVNDVKADGQLVVLAGDGRADTPGHSAKYGSYNMLDLNAGQVVDVQVVQSNEVKSSCHMEKEGLIRSVAYLKQCNIQIHTLVTDRHVQIVKWVRENLTGTIHYFDVWHVAKGLKKKLFALSKEKDCGDIKQWIKSIINHVYWVASVSEGLESEAVLARWNSLLNHIIDIHKDHHALFPMCEHGRLTGRERRKKWLKPGTKVYEKLQGILTSRQMKKDVVKLSPNKQTSALEGYHSVINHFAPKMIGFSYHGMLCRLWLAALHFNENTQRNQAVTKDGKARYKVTFPKHKKGGYTVRNIMVDSTYDYVECLTRAVFELGELSSMNSVPVQIPVPSQLKANVPPPLCNEYERPDKDEAVQSFRTRFSHCQPCGSQHSFGLD